MSTTCRQRCTHSRTHTTAYPFGLDYTHAYGYTLPMKTLHIPNRYWQHLEAVSSAHGVEPIDLFEHAAWLTAERALDILVAQDEGNTTLEISDDLHAYIYEVAPVAFVFGFANLNRLAQLLAAGKDTPEAERGSRDADGRFLSLKPLPMTGPEGREGNLLRALIRVK